MLEGEPTCTIAEPRHWNGMQLSQTLSQSVTVQNVHSERGLKAVFRADILTCHTGERTGVTNNINDDCSPFRCSSSKFLILTTLTDCQWLTGTCRWNRAICNVMSFTCATPAVTSQKVCREKWRPACDVFWSLGSFLFFCSSGAFFLFSVDEWPNVDTTIAGYLWHQREASSAAVQTPPCYRCTGGGPS